MTFPEDLGVRTNIMMTEKMKLLSMLLTNSKKHVGNIIFGEELSYVLVASSDSDHRFRLFSLNIICLLLGCIICQQEITI